MSTPLYSHDPSNMNHSVQDAARSSAVEMQKYFGPLRNSDIDTFASDAFAHETHNLPRAYVGRNKFLMATIDFLITKDDDWYTRYVLPWLYTEELSVKWNIWRFNKTMMDYEPEQGVPRYVSYESESRSDSLVRRGLAFIIEHGFYKTELGKQHYLMNLKQIVEAVHETVYFGVIHELLAAPNFYEQWQRKHGQRHSIMTNDVNSAMAEERWRFACVQKDIKGLYIMDAELKDRMRRVGIEPTAWIFPSKMAIYASMVPEYFNEYMRGGNPATTALEDGAKRFDTFRGCQVFETRPFDTDFMSEGAVEPLMRDRQIGEFYVMDEDTHKHGIKIFDMSRDRFETIMWKDVAKHAWKGETGPKGVLPIVRMLYDGVTEISSQQIYKSLLRYSDKRLYELLQPQNENQGILSEDVIEPARKALSISEKLITYDAQKNLQSIQVNETTLPLLSNLYASTGHLFVDCKYLLFRPRMTYRMGSAILLKGGEELGNTLHGHHDFQLTDDVIHKTHVGHYTYYSKSVVREPKNMYIADDVFCNGYCGGENIDFIKETDHNLESQVTHSSPSIIAVAVPMSYKPRACESLVGDLSRHGIASDQTSYDATAAEIIAAQVSDHLRQDDGSSRALTEDDIQMNGLCFRGAEHVYDENAKRWYERQQNTGHWGPSVYDGCAAVRQGHYAHLKAPGSHTM